MRAPRAAPPPRRSRHPGRPAVTAAPNPDLVRASRPSTLTGPPPLRAVRSRPSRSPAAPMRRPLEGAHPSSRRRPVPCGTSRPRQRGLAATARRTADAAPTDLAWPGPSREPDDRRIGKEFPAAAGLTPASAWKAPEDRPPPLDPAPKPFRAGRLPVTLGVSSTPAAGVVGVAALDLPSHACRGKGSQNASSATIAIARVAAESC